MLPHRARREGVIEVRLDPHLHAVNACHSLLKLSKGKLHRPQSRIASSEQQKSLHTATRQFLERTVWRGVTRESARTSSAALQLVQHAAEQRPDEAIDRDLSPQQASPRISLAHPPETVSRQLHEPDWIPIEQRQVHQYEPINAGVRQSAMEGVIGAGTEALNGKSAVTTAAQRFDGRAYVGRSRLGKHGAKCVPLTTRAETVPQACEVEPEGCNASDSEAPGQANGEAPHAEMRATACIADQHDRSRVCDHRRAGRFAEQTNQSAAFAETHDSFPGKRHVAGEPAAARVGREAFG